MKIHLFWRGKKEGQNDENSLVHFKARSKHQFMQKLYQMVIQHNNSNAHNVLCHYQEDILV